MDAPRKPPRSEQLEAEYARIGAERAIAERDVSRTLRRELLRASAECLAACFIGLVIMAFGFRVHGRLLGRIFLFGGMAAGYAGIVWVLVNAYRRGEERGDW